MTLRARLTLWYGLFVGLVLATALSVGYWTHVTGHLTDLERRVPTMEQGAIAEAHARLDATATTQRREFALIGVAGLIVALAGGWAIARTALRPVAVMTETARAIADSGQFSGRVPSVTQSDELGTLARTFNEMLESLEAAYGVQQRFVADASHELRTPIATIQGSAELLASEEIDAAERQQTIGQIRRESRRLARLIDDLLVLARADAGSDALRGEDVHVDEVLMEAFEELRAAAGRRLRVTALEDALVHGERDRLKQLVLILLDNALRYTPGDGRIDASVSCDRGSVVLEIDDEGVGVTPAVAARAFERFYRGEAARRMDPSGTGLGLSIARWIVERHLGRIELGARPGRGARVVVRLPQALGSSADRSATHGRSAQEIRAG